MKCCIMTKEKVNMKNLCLVILLVFGPLYIYGDGTIYGEKVQDHFEFLQTDKGYKLVGVSVRSKE